MKIYLTSSDNAHPLLDELLRGQTGSCVVEKNQFGKPYVRGNQIYFNLSHSGNYAVVALSDRPVGVDIEALKGRGRGLLISRFSDAEQAEIKSEADFLIHFTAREAYVKNLGGSLFALYKRLSFVGGNIYLDGVKQDCKIASFARENFVFSVCGEGDIEVIEI